MSELSREDANVLLLADASALAASIERAKQTLARKPTSEATEGPSEARGGAGGVRA